MCVCVCVAKPVAVELRCHATALILSIQGRQINDYVKKKKNMKKQDLTFIKV